MGQWVYNADPEVNDLSRYPTIIGVCVGLTTLMSIVVGMRIWVRARIVKSMGVDDWIIMFSMICSIIYNALCITQSRYGLGLPLQLRPAINLNHYSTVNFAGRPFYMAGITGFKVALCFAYLRITSRSRSNKILTYRNIIWLMMAFSILTHLGGTLVLLFQCHPIKKSWRPHTPGHCLRNDITFYVLAALTIVCDVIIFVLPIPLLAKLQINIQRKIALIGIFTLGLFTTFCSVMRMIQITQIAKDGNSTMLVLWGTIEMNVGITLTCLPTLTPLLTYLRERTRIASSRYQQHGGYEKKEIELNRKTASAYDKEAFQISGKSRHSIYGVGINQTTITANDPSSTIRSHSDAGSEETILASASNTVSSSGKPRSSKLVGCGYGYITRTMEVSIHREDMSEDELRVASPVPR